MQAIPYYDAREEITRDVRRHVETYTTISYLNQDSHTEKDTRYNHYEMSAIIPMLTKGKEIYSKVTQPVEISFTETYPC